MNAQLRSADEVLLGFTRALRAAGVAVTQDRAHGFLTAVAEVGLDDRQATYWAGRATLCGSPDDLARFDQVKDVSDHERDQAFANILAAARHYGVDVAEDDWRQLGKPAN